MGVGRGRIDLRQARSQRPESRRRGRPQTECAVDVEPCVRQFADQRHDLLQGIECAAVHVAELDRHDHRPLDGAERAAEGVEPHPSLLVRGDAKTRLLPETHQPEGLRHARVDFLAGDDGHGRRSLEAVGLHVPARSMQVMLAVVAPVVNPTLVSGARPSNSTSQAPAITSTAAAGVVMCMPAF